MRPGGVFLNHGIARRATAQPEHGPNFSDTCVFPDNVYQALLVRPDARGHSGLPLTRADWYAHKKPSTQNLICLNASAAS